MRYLTVKKLPIVILLSLIFAPFFSGTNSTPTSIINLEPLQALPTKEIQQKLKTIPVFILTDSTGKQAITIKTKDKKGSLEELGIFFFGPRSAQAVITELKNRQSSTNKNPQIKIINLNEAYELVNSNKKDTTDKIVLSFQPEEDEIQEAMKILKAEGKTVKQFQGIPLFYAAQTSDNALMSIEVLDESKQKVEREVIPLFFSKADLDDILNDMKKDNPQLASKMKIQVTTLDSAVKFMQESDRPQLRKVEFVPSTESLKYIRENK